MDYVKRNDGSLVRCADGAVVPFDTHNEDYVAYVAWVAAGHTAVVAFDQHVPPPTAIEQIHALESQVTQRRLREALLGTDNGWLAGIDAQIAYLRAQL